LIFILLRSQQLTHILLFTSTHVFNRVYFYFPLCKIKKENQNERTELLKMFKLLFVAGKRINTLSYSDIISFLFFIHDHRPMNSKEESNHETCIAKCNEFERTISIMNKSSKPKAFKFDRVYGPNITQKEIYNDAITPIGVF